MTTDQFDHIFWYVGAGFSAIVFFGALLVGGLYLMAFVMIFFPRFHFGAPKNEGELCFYGEGGIITGKSGQRIEPERRMINAPLKIRWWFGITHRPKPSWFIGIIRWQPRDS